MTEEKQQLLEEIFWAMNRIDYNVEDKVETEIARQTIETERLSRKRCVWPATKEDPRGIAGG